MSARLHSYLSMPEVVDRRSTVRAELGYGVLAQVFVSVGRIAPQKNQLGLVEAFAGAFPSTGDARLLRVGGVTQDAGHGTAGADYLRRVEGRIRELGLVERVRITGWRRDVPRFLAAGDVYVQSSLWEGSPLAVVEAMAAGLPVVVANNGGVLPEFRSGTHGWVIPVDDGPALTSALRSAGRLSGGELQTYGRSAQELACGQYDAAIVAGRFFQLASRHAVRGKG